MGKTLVLGNKDRPSIGIPNSDFVQVLIDSLGEEGERKLNEFVSKAFCDDKGHNIDVDRIIIDVDSFLSPEYCLYLILSIRLSLYEIKSAALAPIMLLTNMTHSIFKGYEYSNVILTGSTYIGEPKNLEKALTVMKPLEVSDYKGKFLNRIKIPPKPNEGHHSIANQWGADVLSRVVLGENLRNESVARACQSLYFKYVRVQTLNVDEFGKVIGDGNRVAVSVKPQKIDAKGKKVLLIDDEARNGWEDVLKKWLDGSDLEVICEQVPDYESLSQEARQKIEKGDYDLIFLDLRMNGSREESHTKPKDFSGMKILKKMKELNKGTQVIMLTASNKVWNMKALFDAGADGYYVKESPEYAFPLSYSEKNAQSLCEVINQCFENGWLKKLWRDTEAIRKLISEIGGDDNELKVSRLGINVAFDLLTKSKQRGYMPFAFLQLFMPIENYVKKPGMFKIDNGCLYYKENEHCYEIADALGHSHIMKYDSVRGLVFHQGGNNREGNHIKDKNMSDTYLRVSSILICKFGEDDTNGLEWKKICEKRNDVAHRPDPRISIDDIKRVVRFMKFFFDDRNANWREV